MRKIHPKTLADLLSRAMADTRLSDVKRRNLCSSIRSFSKYVGKDLTTITASFPLMRPYLQTFKPTLVGITGKRWSNIKSDIVFAMQRYGVATRAPLPRDLSDEWRTLQLKLDTPSLQRGLSRLIHWCNMMDILPTEVGDEVAHRFHEYLLHETFHQNPNRVHRASCVHWNRASKQISGWPILKLTVPNYREVVSLPLEQFPKSFADDLERWEHRVSCIDLLANDNPDRPLRPATIYHRRQQFIRFASALVRRGIPIERIVSLSVLVEQDLFIEGLRFFVERNNNVSSPSISELAEGLIALARKWVCVSSSELKTLKGASKNLKCRKFTLSDKNLERLRQFDDRRAQARLLALPDKLLKLSKTMENDHKSALMVQWAVAIEILIMAPIRLLNLTSLNLDQHLSLPPRGKPGSVHLFIPAHEVKNDQDLSFTFPNETAQLVRLYIDKYRPRLLKGSDDGWLFPGQKTEHKNKVTLSQQIIKAIEKHAALVMNVHLFRHLAAKLYLDANPGQYETVRRLLGHKNINTTIRFYCGFETAKAVEHYDKEILKLRLGVTV